jgi:ATP-dependent DNA helicase RecG
VASRPRSQPAPRGSGARAPVRPGTDLGQRAPAAGRGAALPAPQAPLLERPVQALPGIGPRRAAALATAGIELVRDLLWHLPRAWEDRRGTRAAAAAVAGEVATFEGRLRNLRWRRLRGRGRTLIEGELADPSGTLGVVWFGLPYLIDRLPVTAEVRLHGRVGERGGRLVISHPGWQLAEPGAAGLVPVYPPLPGTTDGLLRRALTAALAGADLERELPEPLPRELLRRRGLPTLAAALRQLHAPAADTDSLALAAWRTPAQQRLVYGELLAHQLELARRARALRRRRKPHRYRIDDGVRERARAALPFPLT